MAVKKASKKGAAKKVDERKSARPVQQNATEKWSLQKERAALLVAEDRLSDERIAAELEIDRSTLHRWKTDSEFAARVDGIVAEIREKLLARGIAEKQNRLDALNDRHKRMVAVIEARAKEHKAYKGGGSTGLLVRQAKSVGSGKGAQIVDEYAVDTALLKELREHEKQVAIELGEWTEKSDVKHGGTIRLRRAEDLTDDELAAHITD